MDGGLGSLRPDGARAAVRHRQVVSAFDLDEVFANMPKWQIEHQILARPVAASSCGMLLLDEIGLASNRMGGRTRATGTTPVGQLAIAVDIASPVGRQFGGRALGANDALMGYSGAELDYLLPAGLDDLSMILPGVLVEDSLQQRLDAPVNLARLRSARVADAGRISRPGHWRLFGQLAGMLHGEASLPPDGAALAQLRAEVLDAVTSLVGHYFDRAASDRNLWHQRRPVVLRAIDFMRANLGEPVTLADICSAARASERTVEYAFRDLYGVGAKRYLKILRLHAVRRQLRRLPPDAAVIQDLAQDAGFWHMGHFSADYRLLFGEAPTESRRQRPALSAPAVSVAAPGRR